MSDRTPHYFADRKPIAIQGGIGSFHEQAAHQLFGVSTDLSYESTFRDVFDSLQSGATSFAVLAIANNSVGYIHEPYTYITAHGGVDIWIVGETYVRVEHQLLGIPGSDIGQLTQIYSQAPALSQCVEFLHSYAPQAVLIEADDTARSAELVAVKSNPHLAAIASSRAGLINNLETLASNIQDDPDNITRFLLISRDKKLLPKDTNKSTCLLNTGQSPGALLAALEPFRDENINISSLQSLFIPNSAFHMQFFIEFEAGYDDDRMFRVHERLKKSGCTLKILGSYMSQKVPIK